MGEPEVVIETRPATVTIKGPSATPAEALALLEATLSLLARAPGSDRLEAGGMGFSAELNDPDLLH
jgi:hypothetical protein